ncbi:MAG TPA: ABC transporter substrate-binding protein [bacterium]|nr:ABC transporter substrate-binding protein [bacterium]
MSGAFGSRSHSKLNRRQFLTAAGAGVAGGALLRLAPWEAGVAPAQIKGTTLRILTWSHFVPAYDTAFDKYAVDWGKTNGVDVRVDHISIDDLPARIAAELAAGAGHDIFQMNGQIQTTLYYKHMVDVSDICDKLGKDGGGWLPMAKNVSVVGGQWYAVPEFYIPQPMMWRGDLWKQYNLPLPSTWENLRKAAAIGKKNGHPAGFAISHCNDSNHNWRAVFYAFGVHETDPSGKELAWDSKALRDAMNYSKALWSEGMTSEVFSWDNVSDNRYLDSGVAIYIHDALSSLFSVEESNRPLFDSINAGVPGDEPKGSVRSAAVVDPTILAIWNTSKNQAGAKAFLEQYGGDVKFSLEASKGYNMPYLQKWYKKPMPGLATHLPKLDHIQDWGKVALVFGYPGPATAPASEVLSTFVVPDMLARYCHGESVESSIGWGLGQIKGIYAKYK